MSKDVNYRVEKFLAYGAMLFFTITAGIWLGEPEALNSLSQPDVVVLAFAGAAGTLWSMYRRQKIKQDILDELQGDREDD